jgi:hypothetical protein
VTQPVIDETAAEQFTVSIGGARAKPEYELCMCMPRTSKVGTPFREA